MSNHEETIRRVRGIAGLEKRCSDDDLRKALVAVKKGIIGGRVRLLAELPTIREALIELLEYRSGWGD